MSKPFVKIEDFTDAFTNSLKAIQHKKVLVGIPEDENQRTSDPGSPIGNAALLFINNFGSPANNIPPRPVMNIGIFAAQDEITEQMKLAATNAFKKDGSVMNRYYERAGIVASNSIKRVINDQIGIESPAESTLKRREAEGFKGTKALIVTAQMRNAITYVVEG